MATRRFSLPEHPSDAWRDSEREETRIYPEEWIDELRSKGDIWWQCPWFVDYPIRQYPEDEKELYDGEFYVLAKY